MASDSTKTAQLTTQRDEFIKSFTLYDGASRPITIFTAPTALPNAKPCSRVDYEYINGTSFKVLKMKESNGVWDETWDI